MRIDNSLQINFMAEKRGGGMFDLSSPEAQTFKDYLLGQRDHKHFNMGGGWLGNPKSAIQTFYLIYLKLTASSNKERSKSMDFFRLV